MKFEYYPGESWDFEFRTVVLMCAALIVDCEENDENCRRIAQERDFCKRSKIKINMKKF